MNNDYLLKLFELEKISQLLYKLTGNTVDINKKEMLSSRWGKLLRELNLSPETSFINNLNIIEKNHSQNFINRYTTNTTYFFREIGQMNWMYDNLDIIKESSGKLSVLCLPSSSGEEIYSLATILNKASKEQNLIWNIDGFDISQKVLKLANNAVYDYSKSNSKIPSQYKDSWNELFTTEIVKEHNFPDTKSYKLIKNLFNINFYHGNIMEGAVNSKKYDIIFCRNMLIYFEEKEVEIIIGNLLRMLKPDGYLAIGHSETAFGHKDKLTKVSNFNIFKNSPSSI